LPDLTPYESKRAIPAFAAMPEPDDGPVRISVEYTIPEENLVAFSRAIHELQGARLRDGAIRWGIYRDAANPTRMNETFIMESWLDYLRSRERTTLADQALRQRVWELHRGDGPPKVSHQVWVGEVPETRVNGAGAIPTHPQ
jgi:Transmembrane secretion effector